MSWLRNKISDKKIKLYLLCLLFEVWIKCDALQVTGGRPDHHINNSSLHLNVHVLP